MVFDVIYDQINLLLGVCCFFFLSLLQGNKIIDNEMLEYSVHAGVQTTLQV